MRHEKIIEADILVSLPPSVTKVEMEGIGSFGEDVEGEAPKGPPVLQQHFIFCGRMPSRKSGPLRS